MTEPYFNFTSATEDYLNTLYNIIVDDYNATYKIIIEDTEERYFRNTIKLLIDLETRNHYKFNYLTIIQYFSTDKTLRTLAMNLTTQLQQFFVSLNNRKDFYKVIEKYYNDTFKAETLILGDEENRFVEKLMKSYMRNGIHLDDEEFILNKNMLIELESKFGNNLSESVVEIEFSPSELNGLSDSWLETHTYDENTNMYKITLNTPVYHKIMEYCSVEDTRRRTSELYKSMCPENVDLFERALHIRYKNSQKLGFTNHSDYVLEENIVNNSEEALTFIENLNTQFTPLYTRDMEELTTFAKHHGLEKDNLDSWDISYYSRMYKEKTFNLDMDSISKYFHCDYVVRSMFDIFEKLLEIKITKQDTNNKLHESVELYSIHDNSGELYGYFYLDLYPREGKYNHYAVFDMMFGHQIDDYTRTPNIALLCCNFSQDKLMDFYSLECLFHEFGHTLHTICSRQNIYKFNGFGVEIDFVEVPSQLLEFWCYSHDILKMMSCHVETGESLSNQTIKSLRDQKYCLKSIDVKRQIMMTLYDLYTHVYDFSEDGTPGFTSEIYKDIYRRVMNSEPTFDNVANWFGHLLGGYDSQYYSYLRTETYASNVYHMFFEGNETNPEVGKRYKDIVLNQGGTKDGYQILTEMLGEQPNDRYYIMDYGLNEGEQTYELV